MREKEPSTDDPVENKILVCADKCVPSISVSVSIHFTIKLSSLYLAGFNLQLSSPVFYFGCLRNCIIKSHPKCPVLRLTGSQDPPA
jgi:hypothetical protein